MRITCRADQQDQRASGRPWSEKCAEDAASRDHGAQQFGLAILRGQVGNGHWSPAQQAVHVLLAEIANGAPGLQHAPEIAATGMIDVGRSGGQCSGQHFAHFPERLLELGIPSGVFL